MVPCVQWGEGKAWELGRCWIQVMEIGLSKGGHLLAHETETSKAMADLELKKGVIRTPLLALSTRPPGGFLRFWELPLLSFPPCQTQWRERASACLLLTCHPPTPTEAVASGLGQVFHCESWGPRCIQTRSPNKNQGLLLEGGDMGPSLLQLMRQGEGRRACGSRLDLEQEELVVFCI